MFPCLGRRRVVTVLALVSVLIGLVGLNPGTAVVGTEKYTYDALTVSRVEHHATTTLSGESSEGTSSSADSGERSSMATDTSTTTNQRFVATEAAGELANPSLVNNAGAPIRSFVTAADQTYVRVFSGDRNVGAFLTGSAPASADAAVAGLALPPTTTADFIQNVTVPAGTRLQSSIATKAFGQPGGMLQFELLDRIPTSCFGTGRPFR